MPDRQHLVRAARGVVLVERREDGRIVLVAEAVQLCAQVTAEAGVERLGRLELAQHLEVEEELPGALVHERELAALDLWRPVEAAEEAIARELDGELDVLAAARGREHRRIGS